jgi:hypothetical protein
MPAPDPGQPGRERAKRNKFDERKIAREIAVRNISKIKDEPTGAD